MKRSALKRSALFVVLVASLALTGQSTFGQTIECRASPGPPAAPGMHWYFRVDRTNNRHCWYLQSADTQVRSHEIVPLSKPRPQIVAERSLGPSQKDNLQTSPLRPAMAERALIEPSEPPVGVPSAAHFTARWLDLPASVDLGAHDFAPPRRDYAIEQVSPHSEELMLSTRLVAPDTISQLPHTSTNAVKFGSVFIAGAISVILFGTLLKLSRMLSSSLRGPRLKIEVEDSSEISLSELMRALRRVDETLKAAETRHYSPLKPRELVADKRAKRRSSRSARTLTKYAEIDQRPPFHV
jgi:hypothetical protein